MFLAILILLLPFAILSVIAWRYGADSRDWRTSGEWHWVRGPIPDGTKWDD